MRNVLFLVSGVMVLYTPDVMAQNVPTPDHVVIVMLENEGYGSIVGNSNAPFINSLANDPANAVFTQSFALTHPSQPNYLMLYAGDNQGVTNDNNITNSPFSTPNLGASLLAAGLTFKGYSEDLPAVGALDFYYASYARKHAPWTNWQGTGMNRVPANVNQPFSNFPANYNNLPTVSFVIPNLVHDMHDPTSNPSTAIANGDAWVAANLTAYITWCKTHNSLLILTFDEDGGNSGNNITTIFMGQMVNGGNYSNHIDHYNVLRTLEDMYGLPYAGASANKTPITNCWVSLSTGVGNTSMNNTVAIGPIPAHENFNISMNSTIDDKVNIVIYDIQGKLVKDDKVDIQSGKNTLKVDVMELSAGAYIVKLKSSEVELTQKIVLE